MPSLRHLQSLVFRGTEIAISMAALLLFLFDAFPDAKAEMCCRRHEWKLQYGKLN